MWLGARRSKRARGEGVVVHSGEIEADLETSVERELDIFDSKERNASSPPNSILSFLYLSLRHISFLRFHVFYQLPSQHSKSLVQGSRSLQGREDGVQLQGFRATSRAVLVILPERRRKTFPSDDAEGPSLPEIGPR